MDKTAFDIGVEETLRKIAVVDQVAGYFIGKHYGRKQKKRGEKHNFGGTQAASALLPGGAGYQAGRYVAHNEQPKAKKV